MRDGRQHAREAWPCQVVPLLVNVIHYITQAGSEGIELIMWLVMRGALGDGLTRIHDTYHVPASNTAAAPALFQAPPARVPVGASSASGEAGA